MYPAMKELFLETAKEDGWLEEHDMETARIRDIEIARGLKADNVPVKVIIKHTRLTLQEVEAL